MAQAPQHGAVDALHPDVQAQALPMGPVGRPLGQLQGRHQPGHRPEEALRPGGDVLPALQGRQPRELRAGLPGNPTTRRRRE